MAGVTHTFALQIKDDALRVVAIDTTTKSGDIEFAFSDTVAGTGDTTITFAIDHSKIVSFWIVSDKDVTMTENVGPDLTVSLVANVPYWWHSSLGSAHPISVDVVYLKFANAGATIATVSGSILTTV